MALMKTLAQSGNKDVKLILDKLCVWFVPMLNPDGWEIFDANGLRTPRRQNVQTWDPWGDWLAGGTPFRRAATTVPTLMPLVLGYDINRDFCPNMDWDMTTATLADYLSMARPARE